MSKLNKIILSVTLLICCVFSSRVFAGNSTGIRPDTLIKSLKTRDSLKTDTLKSKKIRKKSEINSRIDYKAKDSIRFDVVNQVVYLYGDAEIKYETITLKADYIEVNWETHQLYATGLKDSSGNLKGTPEFTEKDQKFRSREMRYNFNTRKGKISNIITKEGEGYIHGETVKKDNSNNFYVAGGFYTTCDRDTPHFYIAAGKIKVIQNNKIITGPAYLVIENVPTPFIIPFGLFPNRKGQSSGILMPAIGESSSYGFSLENGGYYFGFNDYVTLTLRGDLYSKGSYAIKPLLNYNNRYHYSGKLDLGYSLFKTGEEGTADYSRTSSYFIRWNHTQDPKANPTTRFSASVNAGSSNYFKRTLNTSSNDYLSNNFNSSISLFRNWPGKPFNFTANLSHSQNVQQKTIDLRLPDLAFNVSRINPFKRAEGSSGTQKWYEQIGVQYSASASNTLHATDSTLFTNKSLKDMQNGIRHSIPISTSFKVAKYFSLSPALNYNERWYFQSLEKHYDPSLKRVVEDTARSFASNRDFDISLNLSTKLYGMFQTKKAKIAALRHVLTPSVNFRYSPDFSEKFWNIYKSYTDSTGKEIRYSPFERSIYGGPGKGKSAVLGLNLENNLEMKLRTMTDTGMTLKKVKILETFSVGSGYNFFADSLRLQNISIRGGTTLLQKMVVSFSGTLDPYYKTIDGRDQDQLLLKKNGRLGNLTSGSLAVSANLNPSVKPNAPATVRKDDPQLREVKLHPEDYVDFNIPWNLNLNFSLNYSNTFNQLDPKPVNITEALSFNGELKLTPKWKFTFTSGYDFKNKDFTYTSINIYRDLHCWEMKLNWIPFGFRQSYNFQINVKSSILQDLKLLKKNPPNLR